MAFKRFPWKFLVFFLTFMLMVHKAFGMSAGAGARTGLRVGTDVWPPYEVDDVSRPGLSSEITLRVLSRMGFKNIGLERYPWSRAELYLMKGELDLLFSASLSKKRENYAYFPSEALIDTPWVFFIRKSDEQRLKFEKYSDLLGHTIGVVKDYSYTPEFWNFLFENGNYQVVTHEEHNFKKLVRGRVDFIITELRNGLAMSEKLGLKNQVIALSEYPIKVTGLYAMFSKKTISPEFVEKFSNELKIFKGTPEYHHIIDYYLPILPDFPQTLLPDLQQNQ